MLRIYWRYLVTSAPSDRGHNRYRPARGETDDSLKTKLSRGSPSSRPFNGLYRSRVLKKVRAFRALSRAQVAFLLGRVASARAPHSEMFLSCPKYFGRYAARLITCLSAGEKGVERRTSVISIKRQVE